LRNLDCSPVISIARRLLLPLLASVSQQQRFRQPPLAVFSCRHRPLAGSKRSATDASAAGQIAPEMPPRPERAAIPALSIGGVSHSYGLRHALALILSGLMLGALMLIRY
jgi:hypothetical protein